MANLGVWYKITGQVKKNEMSLSLFRSGLGFVAFMKVSQVTLLCLNVNVWINNNVQTKLRACPLTSA